MGLTGCVFVCLVILLLVFLFILFAQSNQFINKSFKEISVNNMLIKKK